MRIEAIAHLLRVLREVTLQGTPVWEALLRFAVQQGVDAVIDCGALLAGVSNRCRGGWEWMQF